MRHSTPLLWFVALVALLAVSFRPAMAASPLDFQRFAIGAGGSYDWYGGTVPAVITHKSEVCADGFIAYDATAAFAATAAVVYGTANKNIAIYPGAHYRLSVGSEDFALALSYAFYGGSDVPRPANEWVAAVIYSRPLWVKALAFSASEALGLDTKLARTSVQLSVPIFVGRNSQ
jgi:hypothetical protein